MRWIRHLRNGAAETAEGQSLMEFALIVPVLVLILMGIFDLGRSVYYYNVASETAREAARRSIMITSNCSTQDPQTISAVVNQTAGVPITTSGVTITPCPRNYQSNVTVTVAITYTAITPLIGNIIGNGGSLVLRAQSSMAVEGN